jgi:hypothetical protein
MVINSNNINKAYNHLFSQPNSQNNHRFSQPNSLNNHLFSQPNSLNNHLFSQPNSTTSSLNRTHWTLFVVVNAQRVWCVLLHPFPSMSYVPGSSCTANGLMDVLCKASNIWTFRPSFYISVTPRSYKCINIPCNLYN